MRRMEKNGVRSPDPVGQYLASNRSPSTIPRRRTPPASPTFGLDDGTPSKQDHFLPIMSSDDDDSTSVEKNRSHSRNKEYQSQPNSNSSPRFEKGFCDIYTKQRSASSLGTTKIEEGVGK